MIQIIIIIIIIIIIATLLISAIDCARLVSLVTYYADRDIQRKNDGRGVQFRAASTSTHDINDASRVAFYTSYPADLAVLAVPA